MDEQPSPAPTPESDAPDTVVIQGTAAEPADPGHAPAAVAAAPPSAAPVASPAVALASRRPTPLLLAALALAAVWAIAATAGFAVERNAHNDDRTTLKAQVSDRDRQLAELQSQHKAMAAKLAETSKLALTPAQHKALQTCVADVRRTADLLTALRTSPTIPPELLRRPGNGSATIVTDLVPPCDGLAKAMP
jgi:hypothetical protein